MKGQGSRYTLAAYNVDGAGAPAYASCMEQRLRQCQRLSTLIIHARRVKGGIKVENSFIDTCRDKPSYGNFPAHKRVPTRKTPPIPSSILDLTAFYMEVIDN